MSSPQHRDGRAFILVMTLALLALLVLAVLGIVASARVASQVAETNSHRVVARQNALLALGIALGELQRHAAPADVITAMAGTAGVAVGTGGAKMRQWCAAWEHDAVSPRWLVSGARTSLQPMLMPDATPVILVGPNTVGAESSNSEHVIAGRIPVPTQPYHGQAPVEQGGCAWWIGDEGVKLRARPSHDAGGAPAVTPPATPSSARALRDALTGHAENLGRVLIFEQLRFLPSPSAPLALGTLRDNFHSVTLAAPGRINLNTTNVVVWRALLETFAAHSDDEPLTPAQVNTAATRIQNNFARAFAGQPCRSVAEFMSSDLLGEALKGTEVEATDFATIMGGALTTRSQTFRIRAYGDALSRATGAIASVAHCEAIVHQRIPNGQFEITYFRWLGPDDI